MLPIAILAGGLATRLQPITEKIPKSLVEVHGKPFVVYQLSLLRANGIRRAVLCVGHLGELIQKAIGDGSSLGMEVDYSFDGPALLGTAGAIRNALPKLGAQFFVIYGDSYLPCDYGAIVREFESSGALGLMTVYRNEGKFDTSNVEFENGRILAYSKKNQTPRMHHIDYGLGVFRAEAFTEIAPGTSFDLADLYGNLLQRGKLAGFEVHTRFYEIGSAAGLKETDEFLAAQKAPTS